MSQLHRIISNTIISLLGQAVSYISTLLLTVAYGHFLGAFKFGELFFAITFVLLLGIPIQTGYDNQIIRGVAQEPEKALRYYSNILLIKLTIWPIVYALALLVSWLLGYTMEVRVLVGICGLYLLSSAIGSTFTSLHYAFERTLFPVIGNLLEKGLTALISILLLEKGARVEAMALVMVVGSLIGSLWQAIWFFRMVGSNVVIDLALIREIVRTSIPFLIFGVLLVGYTNIDTILLSLLTNNAVVGWYGAVTRLFDALNFLPTIVISVIMYPIFSRLSTTSDARLKLAVEKSVNLLLFCVIPMATALIVAAPAIIGLLYPGPDFIQSIPALQAFAPGLVFVYLNYALATILMSKKQERKLAITAAITLAFNLGLNCILIPLYQHTGAAIVASLTEMLLCGIAVIFIPRPLLPLASLRVAFKALIASLVMALVLLLLHTLPILVLLPIALLVYLGAAVLLGTIPREDYQAVYCAIRQKVQLTARTSNDELPMTPLLIDQSRVSNNDDAWQSERFF